MVLPIGFQDSAATTVSTPTGWTVRKATVTTGTLKSIVFARTRQSGDSTWKYAPSQSVETSHVVLSITGADASSSMIGGDGTRAASGGANATTAPSITTTTPGMRVYLIATERTLAAETVEATVNNGFTKISHTYDNITAESIFLAYKDIATAGAVGATTVTFQNSHASNGYATLLAVAPASSTHDFSGVTAAVSSASGSFTTRRPIAGTAAALSAATAELRASLAVAGTSNASADASATFTITRSIEGSVDAASTSSASFTTSATISGTVQVVTTATGTFTATHAPAPIAGTASASSQASATFTREQTITATVELSTSAGAEFTAALTVTGITATTTTASASFTVGGSIPVPPIPPVRTLIGIWSTTLTGQPATHTLAGLPVAHTLEDA